jgi:hypothetical protein
LWELTTLPAKPARNLQEQTSSQPGGQNRQIRSPPQPGPLHCLRAALLPPVLLSRRGPGKGKERDGKAQAETEANPQVTPASHHRRPQRPKVTKPSQDSDLLSTPVRVLAITRLLSDGAGKPRRISVSLPYLAYLILLHAPRHLVVAARITPHHHLHSCWTTLIIYLVANAVPSSICSVPASAGTFLLLRLRLNRKREVVAIRHFTTLAQPSEGPYALSTTSLHLQHSQSRRSSPENRRQHSTLAR